MSTESARSAARVEGGRWSLSTRDELFRQLVNASVAGGCLDANMSSVTCKNNGTSWPSPGWSRPLNWTCGFSFGVRVRDRDLRGELLLELLALASPPSPCCIDWPCSGGGSPA